VQLVRPSSLDLKMLDSSCTLVHLQVERFGRWNITWLSDNSNMYLPNVIHSTATACI
jgi:hypothetical protein